MCIYSSFTELGVEAASCETPAEENNESVLLSLFDGNDGFGNFLSNPYDSAGGQDAKDPQEHCPQPYGDEFLPSQLLSELLSGSAAEPVACKVSRSGTSGTRQPDIARITMRPSKNTRDDMQQGWRSP